MSIIQKYIFYQYLHFYVGWYYPYSMSYSFTVFTVPESNHTRAPLSLTGVFYAAISLS